MKNIFYLQKVILFNLLILNSLLFTNCSDDDISTSVKLITKPFVSTWETTTENENIVIYINKNLSGYNYTVDWGDGSIDTNQTESATHNYITTGIHTVSITGYFPAILVDNNVLDLINAEKLKTIESWGDNVWQSMHNAFSSTINFKIMATDVLDLSEVTDMSGMFSGSSFNQDLNSWDVSNVTDMSYMFVYADSFNQDLSNWDVGSVTDMTEMFHDATSFNQDLSNWDVSNVINMSSMFAYANSFNQDLSNWDVGSVIDMSYMFHLATSFNQNIGNWNVSNVINMSSMFFSANSFNQDLSSWATDNVSSCFDFSSNSGMDESDLPTKGCFE